MQKLLDLHQLARIRARFLMDPGEWSAPSLQVCNASHVLVGHPQGEVSRSFRQQYNAAVTVRRFPPQNGLQLIQVPSSVVHVLIVGEPLDAGKKNRVTWRREIALDLRGESLQLRPDRRP